MQPYSCSLASCIPFYACYTFWKAILVIIFPLVLRLQHSSAAHSLLGSTRKLICLHVCVFSAIFMFSIVHFLLALALFEWTVLVIKISLECHLFEIVVIMVMLCFQGLQLLPSCCSFSLLECLYISSMLNIFDIVSMCYTTNYPCPTGRAPILQYLL